MREQIVAETLAFFHELLCERADYGRSREYALSEYGEDNWYRDYYSAGGMRDVHTSSGNFSRLPRIFTTINECRNGIINAIHNADDEFLCEVWGVRRIERDRIAQWIDIACDVRANAGNYSMRDVLESIF
jgi:hypothetical protein